MSRIFDALRNAQRVREGKLQPDAPVERVVEIPDRRRSRRRPVDVAVFVYGHGPGRDTFHEEAHTLDVNASGALLLLSVPVRKGQRLLLTNRQTQQEQDCRVVYLGARHTRTVEAGVAFPEMNPQFWQGGVGRDS
jgi:PilZ domain